MRFCLPWPLLLAIQITALATPDLAVEYTSTHSSEQSTQRKTWRLFRDQTSIEIHETGSPDGEEWILNADQTVSYRRLFHPERRAVEFTPREMKQAGIESNWLRIAHVIAPNQLALLNPNPDPKNPDLVIHAGRINAQQIRVLWSRSLELPEEIEILDGTNSTHIKLTSHHPLASSPWNRLGHRAYHLIELVDLADAEHDPVVKRMLQRFGNGHRCGTQCTNLPQPPPRKVLLTEPAPPPSVAP